MVEPDRRDAVITRLVAAIHLAINLSRAQAALAESYASLEAKELCNYFGGLATMLETVLSTTQNGSKV